MALKDFLAEAAEKRNAPPTVDIEVVNQFKDKNWRLANLYYIVDEQGVKVKFNPSTVQRMFYRDMWYRNVVCKSRQVWMTTACMIWVLDECLFYPNQTANVIAHTIHDAAKLFRTKVDFPYRNLPQGLQDALSANTDTAQELMFSNGSSIGVATSSRSQALQYLIVSEFGKICARWPEKAREIITGSFSSIHEGGYIFIESTAEGREGAFWDMCRESQHQQALKRPLTQLDYKFHFFAWWQKPENRLPDKDAAHVFLSQNLIDYFAELLTKHGIKLTPGQKAWYAKMRTTLGEDMKREHPSHWREAFEQSVEGAYFYEQMVLARRQGRIGKFPIQSGIAVDTWWDIGVDDFTSIWFSQTDGGKVRFVNYYEACDTGIQHYVKYLHEWQDKNEIIYGKHCAPHDIKVREWGSNAMSRVAIAKKLGLKFIVGDKVDDDDQIAAARVMFQQCEFDEVACELGLASLDNFRKDWNENLGTWSTHYRHDSSSHASKAYMVFATMFNKIRHGNVKARDVEAVSARGWT